MTSSRVTHYTTGAFNPYNASTRCAKTACGRDAIYVVRVSPDWLNVNCRLCLREKPT